MAWVCAATADVVVFIQCCCLPCRYCGNKGHHTIDHVTPICKGGSLSWENCVAACRRCNQAKGAKTLDQVGWKLMRQPKVCINNPLGGMTCALWLLDVCRWCESSCGGSKCVVAMFVMHLLWVLPGHSVCTSNATWLARQIGKAGSWLSGRVRKAAAHRPSACALRTQQLGLPDLRLNTGQRLRLCTSSCSQERSSLSSMSTHMLVNQALQ